MFVITDYYKINKYQNDLELAFKKQGDLILGKAGHKGGSGKEGDFYWSEDEQFWLFPRLINKPNEKRYWNAFGIERPMMDKSVGIVCEINFPIEGISRRIAGVFVENVAGEVYIVHRGKIGGGRKGIGKTLFFEKYKGEVIEFKDGEKVSEGVIISNLYSPDLVSNIKYFVSEIDRIKRSI